MGKHFWRKQNMSMHDDYEQQPQPPGCAWGLVHALGFHSNVKKLIHHRTKYDHTKSDWSPVTKMFSSDGYDQLEKLVDKKENAYLSTKTSRKRSLKARIKALISEDTKQQKEGFYLKSSLRRTYSIHHLESLDDSLGKICTDWKHPIIVLPRNGEHCTTQSLETTDQLESSDEHEPINEHDESEDALEIFNVNKELFIKKHLQYADEGISKFSFGALGSNLKAKLSKSRSFPQARKLKPSKLDNKQKEVWSFPKEDKLSKPEENKRTTHRRSSSLNESLDKYARLSGISSQMEAKLNSSKSLKLTNEVGHGTMYFRRIHSVSNVDSFYSELNFGVQMDNPSENAESIRSNESDGDNEKVGGLEVNIEEVTKSDSSRELETNYADMSHKELKDQCYTTDLENGLEETVSHIPEVQVSEDLELRSSHYDELNSLLNSNDHQKSLHNKPFSRNLNHDNNYSDLDYVRQILDQSGIALAASDEPLGPQLFEEVEAYWPHEVDELTGWPDFYGCWHHMMLFHLANEVLLDVYDRSLPYYPKALSSSCHIRTFPVGNLIIEEISKKVSKLLNLKPEEKQSLDIIMDRDLSNDSSWMNLQVESECTALELEDMIFDELIQEFILS
ncbi:hypothetical protein ACJIZ3_012560 [Penstemon smallii]|uniref:DUF4378 domain-containing protein n=1 Tax=Penstemon smallii TaxID=265156 RepID=A0ABD3UQM5_9LAMI